MNKVKQNIKNKLAKFKSLKPIQKTVIITLSLSTIIAITSGTINAINKSNKNGQFVENAEAYENVEKNINLHKLPIEIYMENPEERQEEDSNSQNKNENQQNEEMQK